MAACVREGASTESYDLDKRARYKDPNFAGLAAKKSTCEDSFVKLDWKDGGRKGGGNRCKIISDKSCVMCALFIRCDFAVILFLL